MPKKSETITPTLTESQPGAAEPTATNEESAQKQLVNESGAQFNSPPDMRTAPLENTIKTAPEAGDTGSGFTGDAQAERGQSEGASNDDASHAVDAGSLTAPDLVATDGKLVKTTHAKDSNGPQKPLEGPIQPSGAGVPATGSQAGALTLDLVKETSPAAGSKKGVRPLSKKEMEDLDKCETVVRAGLPTFLDVSMALAEIKRKGLHRKIGTFPEYCEKRFGISRAFAYMQANAGEALENLSTIGGQIERPTTERQLRPLAGLTAKEQVEAWKLAQKSAGGQKVTGKQVEAAVKEIRGQEATEKDWLTKSLQRLTAAGYQTGFEPPVKLVETEWVDLYDEERKLYVKLIDKPTLSNLAICFAMRDRDVEFQLIINGNDFGKSKLDLRKNKTPTRLLDPVLSVFIKNLDAFLEYGGELYEAGEIDKDSKLDLKPTEREETSDLRAALKDED